LLKSMGHRRTVFLFFSCMSVRFVPPPKCILPLVALPSFFQPLGSFPPLPVFFSGWKSSESWGPGRARFFFFSPWCLWRLLLLVLLPIGYFFFFQPCRNITPTSKKRLPLPPCLRLLLAFFLWLKWSLFLTFAFLLPVIASRRHPRGVS